MASELSGFSYQDEICINENAGVFIRNALVTKMPPLFLAVRLFNRQDCYLPWWHVHCITGTLLDDVNRLQVFFNGMLIMNHFLITHLVCTRGGVVWKWMRGRRYPGDV